MIFIKPDISIVIPAYREEKRLPYTMNLLHSYIKNSPLNYEIILVVEPSPDKTLEVAKQWEKSMQEVVVIVNDVQLGKGGSVQRGMLNAKGICVGFMDADGATDLSFIDKAYEIIVEEKILGVIASRGLKDSIISKGQPFYRVFLGFIFRKITQLISDLPYQDTQCGCKFFHYSTIEGLFQDIIEKGFAFDVEILLKAKQYNYKIEELPCTWNDKEGSTVSPIKDGLKMLQSIISLKKKYK